jgi:hypothetical protein
VKGRTFYSSVPCPGTNLAIHPCPSVPPTQAWPAPLSPHGNVRPLHDHNHETPSLDLRNSELWDPGQPQGGVTQAPAITAPLWMARGLGHIFRPIGKVTSRPSAHSGRQERFCWRQWQGIQATPFLSPGHLPLSVQSQPCNLHPWHSHVTPAALPPGTWPHPSPAGCQEVSSP